MTYKIIPFKKEHIECMDVREHESHLLTDGTLEGLEGSVAITGLLDGRIISCGGFVPYQQGNAELWQIPSVYVSNHGLSYARFIRKWLEEKRVEFCIRRMETLCLEDDLHNGWMTFLGFEKEGVKRKWINDHDYTLWARIW